MKDRGLHRSTGVEYHFTAAGLGSAVCASTQLDLTVRENTEHQVCVEVRGRKRKRTDHLGFVLMK